MTEKLKALVVFQEIPERIRFLELDVDHATACDLLAWNGKFINGYENEEEIANAIYRFFFTDEGEFFHPETDLPIADRKYDLIITTGIYS